MRNNLLVLLITINFVINLNASDRYDTQESSTISIEDNKEKIYNNISNKCYKLQKYYCWPPKDEISLNTARKIMLSFKYCSDKQYNS